MKKYFAVIVGCLLAANSLMAAYQYGEYLYISDNTFHVAQTSNLTMNVLSWQDWNTKAITDWDSLIVEATDLQGNTTTRTIAITGKTIDIGTVNEGDTLQFYLTGSQGTNNTGGVSVWTSGGAREVLHFAGNYPGEGSSTTNYISVAFKIDGTPVTGGETAPTGQPLPGVLATLLVGGVGAGAFAIRRKKAVAAN